MRRLHTPLLPLAALLLGAVLPLQAWSAVSAAEAAKLKGELTPFGAEKAGNAAGTIPAWTGGYTTPQPGFVNGGKRGDPFANEKPLYSVTAKNLAEHQDKLTDGLQALFKKYPDSYRIDVYPTHRTSAAPQWVYDNTLKNATRAKTENYKLTGAYGGIPFPIPKNGEEVMWNHLLRWRPVAWHMNFTGMQVTGAGKQIAAAMGSADFQMPYYDKDGSVDKFDGTFWQIRMMNSGPAIRAGEGIVGREHLDPDKTQSWVYLPGQRRTRKLPNSCCDTPTPASAGISLFDQTDVFTGRLDRFDWKIIGKKEMIIPYNDNRQLQASLKDLLMPHHLNPSVTRFELHRVWVIEATLRAGQRHVQPKRRYYLDEDTWTAVLADHWGADGQLWQMGFASTAVLPDIPATTSPGNFGFYDLITGAWYLGTLLNDQAEQFKVMPLYPDNTFTPEAIAAAGVR